MYLVRNILLFVFYTASHNLGISSGKSHFLYKTSFLSFGSFFYSVAGLKRQFLRLVFLNNLVVCPICLSAYIWYEILCFIYFSHVGLFSKVVMLLMWCLLLCNIACIISQSFVFSSLFTWHWFILLNRTLIAAYLCLWEESMGMTMSVVVGLWNNENPMCMLLL